MVVICEVMVTWLRWYGDCFEGALTFVFGFMISRFALWVGGCGYFFLVVLGCVVF